MVIAVSLGLALMILPMRGGTLVPSRMQSVAELMYGFVRQMIHDTVGEDGKAYFPYIFTIFIFILMSNLLGLIPGSFTTTSHVAVTGLMAITIFLTVTAIGFITHGLHFIHFFWVSSAPTVFLRCVLFVIELISYFVRPVSHSVRLAGNMMAGHAVLKVFAAFVPAMGVFGVVPIAAMVGFTALEVLVACVQAYIFAILTCVYLNDALHMH
jgi:F-type H+-transporting ATPase subunit a